MHFLFHTNKQSAKLVPLNYTLAKNRICGHLRGGAQNYSAKLTAKIYFLPFYVAIL